MKTSKPLSLIERFRAVARDHIPFGISAFEPMPNGETSALTAFVKGLSLTFALLACVTRIKLVVQDHIPLALARSTLCQRVRPKCFQPLLEGYLRHLCFWLV